jgi:putative pre-16S rRNA nuclease
MPRTIGIDYGAKRFGIALSDASGMIARPLEVADGKEKALQALARLIADEDVGRIVVGLPRNMDGSLGPKATEVLRFVEELKGRFPIPVETWDERLTSQEAERYLRESGLARSRWKGKVDRVAAQILLQSWLDAHLARGEGGPGVGPESGEGGANPDSKKAGTGL